MRTIPGARHAQDGRVPIQPAECYPKPEHGSRSGRVVQSFRFLTHPSGRSTLILSAASPLFQLRSVGIMATQWHYQSGGGEERGPVSFRELVELVRSGAVTEAD